MASPSSTRSRRSFWAAIVAALTFGSSLLVAGVSAPSVLAGDKGDAVGPVEVSSAVYSDVSAPVRDLVGVAPAPSTDKEKKEKPLRVLPNKGNALNQADGALQTTSGPLAGTTNGLNFAGVGAGDYQWISDQWAPPDTNGAVGQTQYVQWVNTSFAVFDKATGAIVSGFPKLGNSIWAGFAGGGGGCQTNNDGDPIVQYDKLANRWILTQFSVSTTPYLQCIAVSTTSDATGTYNRYAFTEPYFNDYPKLGVWPDGYYLTFNMFNGNSFAGARACALDRAKMLTGDPAATQQCFQLSTSYGGLLPSDLDGTTPPPDGSPEFFLNFVNAFNGNSLNLWKFHVDFTIPANSTFSRPSAIPVAAFSTACLGGGTCIPQRGTSNKLDSLADRLMYRLAYRNFGDHEVLVVNHSVTVSGVTSVRWYEIRSPNGTPGVFQQGTLGTSDGISRWMGSIAMDHSGDIALGYSASSSSVYPSIRYTGRVPGDPLGIMESETVIQPGAGYQATGLTRWGDYSAMSVDPVDDCTFWYTNEYLKGNGTWNWSTRIASFKFPGCVPTAPLTITTTSLPAGTVGSSYSQTIGATGGTTPYAWSVSSGTLPTGLSLDASSGVISGTPTAAASSSFFVTVTDSATTKATKALSIVVNPAATPLSITTISLPAGTVGSSYSQTIGATGGTTPYAWSVSSGTLPTGLSLDASSGVISGTPTAAASSSFFVTVTDSATTKATKALGIVVNPAPLTITTTSLPAGTGGQLYTQAVIATGGTTPYTWSSSTLPAGLSLTPSTDTSSVTISWKPTKPGNYSFTVTVTDSSTPTRQTASQTLSIRISKK